MRELVRWAPDRVVDVYVTPDAAARHPEIVASLREPGDGRRLFWHVVTPEVLAAMSADAQGVVAVAQAGPAADLEGALDGAFAVRPGVGPARLVAVLTEVRDPGNAGTVIRAADAAGADVVVLTSGSVDPHNPKVVRSTAGSLFHLPVVTGVGLDEVVAAARSRGLTVLAADGAGDLALDTLAAASGTGAAARTAGAPDLAAPTAWVFGTEAQGLTAGQRALADAVVRVPIRGLAESLNLATAATVCLYASSDAQHR